MLRNFNTIKDCVIQGTDGIIGSVSDVYFNDQTWDIRYLAANTASWLDGRYVLIAKESLLTPKWETGSFPVTVSQSQVKDGPPFEIDQPITWKKEREICAFYRWATYFPLTDKVLAVFPGILTSANGLTDFSLKATDGEIGKIINFVVDDISWTVRYVIVDTSKWLAGRKILLSPMWSKSILWDDRMVEVDLTKEQVEHSPEFDPFEPIERIFEDRLYKHYGKPQYW